MYTTSAHHATLHSKRASVLVQICKSQLIDILLMQICYRGDFLRIFSLCVSIWKGPVRGPANLRRLEEVAKEEEEEDIVKEEQEEVAMREKSLDEQTRRQV